MLAHQDEERLHGIYETLRKELRGAQAVPPVQDFNNQIAADRKRGYVFHHSTVDPGLVKELSENRANSVKQELIAKFKLQPNQFAVRGMGWDKPADPNDPRNHAKNRRVEVKVYPAEAGTPQ